MTRAQLSEYWRSATPTEGGLYPWPSGGFRVLPMPAVLAFGYGAWLTEVPSRTGKSQVAQLAPARDPLKLPEALESLGGGMLCDIRYHASSPIPGWSSTDLAQLLGDRYAWLPSLGNPSHGLAGKPLSILDLEGGLRQLHALPHWPVVILCACRKPRGCHRSLVVEALTASKIRVVEWEF